MSSISMFFKPVSKQEAGAAAAAAASRSFELRFSRTSKVVQWDDGLFTDCRPSEADDAMDDTLRKAKQFDHTEDQSSNSFGTLDKEVFGSVDEANAAAKRAVEQALQEHDGITLAKQEDVRYGDLPSGYQLPPTESVAREALGAGGRGTYSGSVTFFCDPFGADVWTVCVTEFTVRTVVEGDRLPPPAAGKAACSKASAGKAATSKTSVGKAAVGKAAAKQPPKGAARGKASAVSKASASRTAISKAKPRGGGAAILSVPGMSKKEVAALNKKARASAAALRSAIDSDSDDYGYSGLKGRSAAFWEQELL